MVEKNAKIEEKRSDWKIKWHEVYNNRPISGVVCSFHVIHGHHHSCIICTHVHIFRNSCNNKWFTVNHNHHYIMTIAMFCRFAADDVSDIMSCCTFLLSSFSLFLIFFSFNFLLFIFIFYTYLRLKLHYLAVNVMKFCTIWLIDGSEELLFIVV